MAYSRPRAPLLAAPLLSQAPLSTVSVSPSYSFYCPGRRNARTSLKACASLDRSALRTGASVEFWEWGGALAWREGVGSAQVSRGFLCCALGAAAAHLRGDGGRHRPDCVLLGLGRDDRGRPEAAVQHRLEEGHGKTAGLHWKARTRCRARLRRDKGLDVRPRPASLPAGVDVMRRAPGMAVSAIICEQRTWQVSARRE
eukprot:scaffold2319_cov105-Isochrysis_galbana.AAC.4